MTTAIRPMAARAARVVATTILLVGGGCGAPRPMGDGGTQAQRGGGSRQPATSQQSGSRARGGMASATNQGSESQGLTCDAALEGAAACVDDTSMLFCAGGSWYLLACDALASGAFCGHDPAAGVVDCYTAEGE